MNSYDEFDKIVCEIVEIFNNVEGVELVRLNGLTKYLNNHFSSISKEDVKLIIKQLNRANVIDFEFALICPHCGEVSYIIKPINGINKLCDSCNLVYQIEVNKTMAPNIFRGKEVPKDESKQ